MSAVTARLVVISLAVSVLAGLWQYSTISLADADSRECHGSHCTFVATYIATFLGVPGVADHGPLGLHTTMSMDIQALPFGIQSTAGQAPPFKPGTTFSVPIDGGGEIVGHAIHYFDSPPIFFESNGRVRAITQGLTVCQNLADHGGLLTGPLRLPKLPAPRCTGDLLAIQTDHFSPGRGGDIIGTWRDTWRAYTAPQGTSSYSAPSTDVQCTTETSGTTATCTSRTAVSGRVRLELTRTVDEMCWEGLNGIIFQYLAQTGNHLTWQQIHEEIENAADFCIPSLNASTTFPGTMISSVYVDFGIPLPSPSPSPPHSPKPTASPIEPVVDVTPSPSPTPPSSPSPAPSASPTPSASPVPTVTFPWLREIE